MAVMSPADRDCSASLSCFETSGIYAVIDENAVIWRTALYKDTSIHTHVCI